MQDLSSRMLGWQATGESWRPHMINPRGPTPLTMDSMRKTALVAGVLYLITFIAVGTLTLYGPVLKDAGYILSSGSDTGLVGDLVGAERTVGFGQKIV